MRLMRVALTGLFSWLLVCNANAQNVGSREQLPETELLKQRIDELERRLKLVEEKFEKPLTVKAPFTVADAGGNPVMRVSNTNGRSITLGPEASPSFKVGEESDGVQLHVAAGNSRSTLKALNNGGSLIVASALNGPYARLVSSPGAGAAAEIVDGNHRAQIATLQGNPRVKLWKADKPVVLLEAGAKTSLKLGDLGAPGFAVEDSPEEVQLNLARSPAKLTMKANAGSGTNMLLAGGQGANVSIESSPAHALVEVQRPGDDFTQLVAGEEGPGLTLAKGNQWTAHLGTPEGKNTALRIYDKSGELALQAGLGSGPEELASVALWKGDKAVGRLFSSFAGEGALDIYRPNGQLAAQLGRMEQEKATALRIFDNSGELAVAAGIDSDNKPAIRVANKGKPVTNMSADEQGRGRIDILDAGKPILSLSADDSGQASLALRNKTGLQAAVLGVRNDAGSLDLFQSAGKLAAQLGPASGKNTALRVFGTSDVAVAAIGIDAEGNGAVRVGNSAGETVASMQAGKDGGGVYALDGSGPVAGIVAEGDRGIVAVYNASTPVAFMTRSSGGDGGNITTALNNGFGVFSAGAAQDGAGEACINRKTQAGTARLACLGLGLPSAGMGK